MKVTHAQNAFTAGELSPRLYARPDIRKYADGLHTCENAIVLPHGGARKRGGTKFVSPVKTASVAVRLVPFQFNVEQSYCIEFGPSYCRFYRDGGIITGTAVNITGITQANPAVVTANSHGFANGDVVVIAGVGGMFEVNGRQFTVANQSTNTFELSGVNSTTYTAYTSGGTAAEVIEIATTYTADELDDLSFAQSADTLYIAHESHPLAKLTRSSHTAWALADADITNGPFRQINTDKSNYLSVAVTGSANISGITRANPAVVTTSAAHDFGEGATVAIASVGGMTEVNGNKYVARNITSTTFELWTQAEEKVNSTGFTTYTSGGTATIATTMFGTISPGSKVTLTAAEATFTSDHVGALFRLWEPGKTTGVATPVAEETVDDGYMYTTDGKVYGVTTLTGAIVWQGDWQYPKHEEGVVRVLSSDGSEYFDSVYLHDLNVTLEILTFSSSTSVTARVVRNHIPESILEFDTNIWEEGAWSEERGYPSVLTFHEQRLWAAASAQAPQTIWASVTAQFENFLDGSDDDRSLIYELASGSIDRIRWMNAGRFLAIGTASSEYIVTGSNRDDALTPSNVKISRQTAYGSSANLQAIRIANSVMFGARSGVPTNPAKKLRELVYSFDSDNYVAQDTTIFSEHITGNGITEMAYQQDPDSIVWSERADGRLVGLTFEREQEVYAWHKHYLGGYSDSGATTRPIIESLCVIPGTDGDELWLAVKRYINGGTVRYIEYLTMGLAEDDDKEDAFFVDCGLTYSGSAATVITGLFHLVGQTVSVLADGAVVADKTVSATGTITLSTAASLVHVGLSYTMTLRSLDIQAGAQAGSPQAREKKIANIYARLHRTLGGTYGGTTGTQKNMVFRSTSGAMDASPDLFSGYMKLELVDGGWDREAQVVIQHAQPLPMHVLALVFEINTTG